MERDISPAFVPNRMDSDIARKLINLEENPVAALKHFRNNRQYLSNYAYWFFLSVIWVKRSDATDLEHWKQLFLAERPNRVQCIMKPSELLALEALPDIITAYRAHRPGETDWISYTTDMAVAVRFAAKRRVMEIAEYEIRKSDVFAYFTRRGENEILLMDKGLARRNGVIPIVIEKGATRNV